MSRKRGPDPLGFTVDLRTTITPEMDEALTMLTGLSRISRAHFVRQAVLDMLTTIGVVFPEVGRPLQRTLTTQPLTNEEPSNA